MLITKVRPSAKKRYSHGNDGMDARWVVDYYCPNCGKPIKKADIACDRCGTFFNWNKEAHIRMIPEIVWE
jgi:predicted RNA-binding Zn-ribbon protein involved in translation (DUF1610 family)